MAQANNDAPNSANARKYPIKTLSLFGSYALGTANEDSDVDLLVEFISPNVSLLVLSEIQSDFEEHLNTHIDLIHGPIKDQSLLKIEKVISLYERH